jgi:1-deoxy-D-xylulose-5-phosphate reductoisomerase
VKKNITVLGSTGSIGVQSLDVAEKAGFGVTAITANSSVAAIEAQIRKFRPLAAALSDEAAAKDLKARVADTGTKVLAGEEGVCECAAMDGADTVIDAIVGLAGLKPALTAVNAKKDLALANKEAIVAGGPLVLDAVKKAGVRLLPVDSEHSAIFQCLQASPPNKALKKLILTASGGPFFGKAREELKNVTAADALKHPTWAMGAKITIDSASMFNKGLEIIEARWLFDMPEDRIQVVIHPESIIHSAIVFRDGAVLAQLGLPDMRVPIGYAMTYPERVETGVQAPDLAAIGRLTFEEPDTEKFPATELAREALRAGGAACTVLNGANEAAVAAFLREEIPFGEIARRVEKALERLAGLPADSIGDIMEADRRARVCVGKG